MKDEQVRLFGKDKKVITSKEIEEKKEAERIENLCEVCKKNQKSSDIDNKIKDLCYDCAKEFYEKIFVENNLDMGFRVEEDKYVFYSQTTEVEEVRKDRILAVIDGFFANEIFPFSIQTCDEFGCFSNCLGVTKQFADYLINELGLEKEHLSTCTCFSSDNTTEEVESLQWVNKKIIPNENAKKINEKKKRLTEKKTDMMKDINEIKELENEEVA